MATVRVLILRAAGTNCDLETEHAWRLAGAEAERVHLRRVMEQPALLEQSQILTLPGGFSYGDDISAGRIFAAQIERRLIDDVRRLIDSGRLVLGICNGFQVLVKAGLLPEPRGTAGRCTITFNEPAGFQDRWVCLEAGPHACAFLEPGRRYEMPIAHGEGRLAFASDDDFRRITEQGLGVLRFVESPGFDPGPVNPNGSRGDIAGLCDPTGSVLGLMPHPERFVVGTQHPLWSTRPARETGDGLAIFQRAVAHFR